MINYFDLGPLHGKEIDMFLDAVNDEYRVHAFEANPIKARQLYLKYKDNKRVKIYNRAIAENERELKLYIEPSGEGSSIFPDKNNVTKKYYKVYGLNFGLFMCGFNNKDTNILRFNIEGAELLMFESLVEYNTLDKFNLFLGSMESDLLKVESLKGKTKYYKQLLKDNNVVVYPYCDVYNKPRSEINNFDLKNWINENNNSI